MNLQERMDLLTALGKYMLSDEPAWTNARQKAAIENGWFIPAFIDEAMASIATSFLQKDKLEQWIRPYSIPAVTNQPKTVGIIMAGNIPMVGFHDLLSVFASGHCALVKTSSKDNVLIPHLVKIMAGWNEEVNTLIGFAGMLKGCDAYIATGSNNTAGYFDYYFGKYPHIIRRNRTSVAVLTGKETHNELNRLADDVFLYFGRGCRNVTKLYAPHDYDFIPLLEVFRKYDWLGEHHKYKNNYDYNLALHLLNHKFFMSTPALLLVEDSSFFSPISQLHYELYHDREQLMTSLAGRSELQCIVGHGYTAFGEAQNPSVGDYADGVDTMAFLVNL